MKRKLKRHLMYYIREGRGIGSAYYTGRTKREAIANAVSFNVKLNVWDELNKKTIKKRIRRDWFYK